jgi:hypothetical protein
MYYIVYKTTNLVNKKYYIGCHKTKIIEDGYYGSGKAIIAALKKYGINNFKREILAFCKNEHEMFEKEKQIVTQQIVEDKQSYNLKPGGTANFYFINKNKLNHKSNQHLILANRLKTDPNFRKEFSKKCSERGKIAQAHRRGQPPANKGWVWVTNILNNKRKMVPKNEVNQYIKTKNWCTGIKNRKSSVNGFYTLHNITENITLTKDVNNWEKSGLRKAFLFTIKKQNNTNKIYKIRKGKLKNKCFKFINYKKLNGPGCSK